MRPDFRGKGRAIPVRFLSRHHIVHAVDNEGFFCAPVEPAVDDRSIRYTLKPYLTSDFFDEAAEDPGGFFEPFAADGDAFLPEEGTTGLEMTGEGVFKCGKQVLHIYHADPTLL